MSTATRSLPRTIGAHAILLTYTAIALFPVILVIMNSFKSRAGIFGAPLTPPTPKTFDLIGYTTVIGQGDFIHYFQNTLHSNGFFIFDQVGRNGWLIDVILEDFCDHR